MREGDRAGVVDVLRTRRPTSASRPRLFGAGMDDPTGRWGWAGHFFKQPTNEHVFIHSLSFITEYIFLEISAKYTGFRHYLGFPAIPGEVYQMFDEK